MRQLFFKAYLSVLALTVVGFVLALVFIIQPLFMPVEWQDFTKGVEVEYRLLTPLLSEADSEQEMQQIVSAYQPVFDLKVVLMREVDLSAAQRAKLKAMATQRILSAFEDSDWYAYYPLPGRDLGLLMTVGGDLFGEFVWEEDKLDIFVLVILPVIFVMASLAIGLILTLYRLSRPLLKLEAAALRLGAGDLSARVNNTRKSPLNSLSGTFNQMADNTAELITRQQIMIAAIPHELRTPLNRIRFALDMSRNQQDIAGLRQSIEKLDDYVEDLSTAVQDILELNRLQQSDQQLSKQSFTRILIRPLLAKATMACEEAGKQFMIECAPDLHVQANSALLDRALLNLIQNAATHAQQYITLNASRNAQNQIVIRVDDDGTGVPEAEREQVFMPFHRLDNSRHRSTGGIGLGLTLVERIVLGHGGVIRALESPAGGLRIEMRFPVIKD